VKICEDAVGFERTAPLDNSVEHSIDFAAVKVSESHVADHWEHVLADSPLRLSGTPQIGLHVLSQPVLQQSGHRHGAARLYAKCSAGRASSALTRAAARLVAG
jgi:hypothetical protein